MTTLQEYLEKTFKKTAREKVDRIIIDSQELNLERNYLDLREFKNLETLVCGGFDITGIEISGCPKLERIYFYSSMTADLDITNNPNLVKINWSFGLRSLEAGNNSILTILNLSNNKLTNVNFLRNLPCPEKLITLILSNNNIQETDLEIFRNFTNLGMLLIGTEDEQKINKGFYNRFYGSLEPLRSLFDLKTLGIENTDISGGLEYLRGNLVEEIRSHFCIKCEFYRPGAKVKDIQEELKSYNYNLLGWQLAHPRLMFKIRGEDWKKSVKGKITEIKKSSTEFKENEEELEVELEKLQIVENELEQEQQYEMNIEFSVKK